MFKLLELQSRVRTIAAHRTPIVTNLAQLHTGPYAAGVTETGVDVKASYFPLSFFLFLCKPRIVIDGGAPELRNWGTHFFPLSPGLHTVKVYFKYLFQTECGANQSEIHVTEGNVVKVEWYMWPWMLAPGSMKVIGGQSQLPTARLHDE